MKLRLMGAAEEITQAAPVLAEVFDVVDQSPPYPCRPPSRLVRVYLDVRLADRTLGGAR